MHARTVHRKATRAHAAVHVCIGTRYCLIKRRRGPACNCIEVDRVWRSTQLGSNSLYCNETPRSVRFFRKIFAVAGARFSASVYAFIARRTLQRLTIRVQNADWQISKLDVPRHELFVLFCLTDYIVKTRAGFVLPNMTFERNEKKNIYINIQKCK